MPESSGTNAAFSLGIVGRISLAGLASAVNTEVGSSTITLAGDDIVDLVGSARNTADSEGSIVEGVTGTHLAYSSNQVVS